MNFWLGNPWMLFGLFALAVPIVLHLLQRRRFDTLDWGAMQFLPDSSAAQRKRWLDELLLMLLRMAMIALIVLALATPFSTSAWLAPLRDRSAREVVIILDGSYSMDMRVADRPTPWQEAVRWTQAHVAQAPFSDRFTYLIARQAPIVVQENELAAATPRGNPDMPRALAEAWKHLQRSTAANKEIIVLTDAQQHGWADLDTLAALEALGNQWYTDSVQAREGGLAVPSLRVVKVGAELPKSLPNYRLDPLLASRGLVKQYQKVTFQSALHLDGITAFVAPRSVKARIDFKGKTTWIPLTVHADLTQKFRFEHRFEEEGQHVVTLKVDADEKNDALPADNEQQVHIDVVKELPILVVDGDAQLSTASSSYFWQRALAAKPAIPSAALTPAAIQPKTGARPAVIVLADVPRLDAVQIEAIDRFLADGGGVLILTGARVEGSKAFYNDQLYRNGHGWLPAPLGEVATSKDGVRPDVKTFQHPALQLFGAAPEGVMNQVRFPKWWKIPLSPDDRAAAIAMLGSGDPFLIERQHKEGRVILCTAPPDRRWGSTLPSTIEFPVLAHELMNYLAGGRSRSTLVPLDPRESNLTRCTVDDWRMVRGRLTAVWQAEATDSAADTNDEGRREDLWWLLLLAVVGLLCSEVWMTRRMALARGR